MILGYGIIAIPTGIVTSEMTKISHKKIPLNLMFAISVVLLTTLLVQNTVMVVEKNY
jgi:hypothetical protein